MYKVLYYCSISSPSQADREKSFIERVTKIAFTDSVHSFSLQRASRSTKEWMINVSQCGSDTLIILY